MTHPVSTCRLLVCGTLVFISTSTTAQNINGHVTDENNARVPYANIFVKEIESGTSTDEKGYYYLTIDPGIYNIVISSIGFKTQASQVIVKDKPVIKNFVLQSSTVELSEIEVRVRRGTRLMKSYRK